jgi:hypothetical protein
MKKRNSEKLGPKGQGALIGMLYKGRVPHTSKTKKA